jgi:hypothetical protein
MERDGVVLVVVLSIVGLYLLYGSFTRLLLWGK